MANNEEKENLGIANRYYEPEDYYREDQISNGLAVTHEQVSDNYMGGEAVPPKGNPSIPRKENEE